MLPSVAAVNKRQNTRRPSGKYDASVVEREPKVPIGINRGDGYAINCIEKLVQSTDSPVPDKLYRIGFPARFSL
jgi:hypothetical protein